MLDKKQWNKEESIRVLDDCQERALRKSGLHPIKNKAVMADQIMEFKDWILDNIDADYTFQGVPVSACVQLATDTFAKSMEMEQEQAKNC